MVVQIEWGGGGQLQGGRPQGGGSKLANPDLSVFSEAELLVHIPLLLSAFIFVDNELCIFKITCILLGYFYTHTHENKGITLTPSVGTTSKVTQGFLHRVVLYMYTYIYISIQGIFFVCYCTKSINQFIQRESVCDSTPFLALQYYGMYKAPTKSVTVRKGYS